MGALRYVAVAIPILVVLFALFIGQEQLLVYGMGFTAIAAAAFLPITPMKLRAYVAIAGFIILGFGFFILPMIY